MKALCRRRWRRCLYNKISWNKETAVHYVQEKWETTLSTLFFCGINDDMSSLCHMAFSTTENFNILYRLRTTANSISFVRCFRLSLTGFTCLCVGNNPNHGYTNFDNFMWSMLTTFQLITLDYWENVYNMVCIQILSTVAVRRTCFCRIDSCCRCTCTTCGCTQVHCAAPHLVGRHY